MQASSAPAAASSSAPDGSVEGDSATPPRLLLTSKALLGDRRELRIEHEGSEYILRATRNGKLILTK
ncbi:MAG TPA: hemin uptake protein HemP [Thauera phenylacetica]|jgi:hemin uptake protein HemP|nr:hemin uptake protein HemP [Thauera phenylacetica]